ncbi:MAG: oligopeptidase A, partial [Mariprofundaceae bacterium]
MNKSSNPLLAGLTTELPLFDQIKPEHVLPALNEVLETQRKQIEILAQLSEPDWQSLMMPLEAMDEDLSRIWGPVSHLNSVCNSDELRPIYQEGVQKVSEWSSDLAQNEALYAAIKKVADAESFKTLSSEQQRMIEHTLRDSRLSGSDLSGDAKERFKTIQMRLSELATTFEQHVLDATRAFELLIEDEVQLAGLPESIQQAAKQRAEEGEKEGWLFTLDIPSYLPFMKYSEKRDLREQMYTAYVTRANDGDLDNTPVIDELLQLRAEAADL